MKNLKVYKYNKMIYRFSDIRTYQIIDNCVYDVIMIDNKIIHENYVGNIYSTTKKYISFFNFILGKKTNYKIPVNKLVEL